jgi:hypothetical protein
VTLYTYRDGKVSGKRKPTSKKNVEKGFSNNLVTCTHKSAQTDKIKKVTLLQAIRHTGE